MGIIIIKDIRLMIIVPVPRILFLGMIPGVPTIRVLTRFFKNGIHRPGSVSMMFFLNRRFRF